MTRKYLAVATPPRAQWDDDVPLLPGLTVFEPESEPRPIGIVDARGNMLHEIPPARPIGFVKLKG